MKSTGRPSTGSEPLIHAAGSATLQAGIAHSYGGDYAPALALVAGIVAIVVALLAGFGLEARGIKFGDIAPKAARA